MTNKVSFNSIVWKYKGKAGWYFVTLPKLLSKKIRARQGKSEEGWGRLKTSAQVRKTIWRTAIWYDTKAQSYLLPLKADIRKKEKITDTVEFHFFGPGKSHLIGPPRFSV